MTGQCSLRFKLAANVAALVAYYVAARLGLILSDPVTHITLVWPATGLAVALLLRGGVSCWPGIYLAVVLAERTAQHSWPVAATIAVTNTLGPLLTVWLLKREGFGAAFERRRDAGIFCAAVCLGMLVTAGGGALNLCWSGRIPWDAFRPAFVRWWLGDSGGVLLAGVFALAVSRRQLAEIRGRWREAALLAGMLLIGGWLALTQPGQSQPRAMPLVFLTMPIIVWGALRFGIVGASFSTLCLSTLAAWATANSRGPFFMADMQHGTLFLWAYCVINSNLGLMITALLAERVQAEEILRKSEASKRAILESAMDCVVATDHEGRITEFNPAAERTFGYTRTEALGRPLTGLIIPPGPRERHHNDMAGYLSTGETVMLERRLELTALRKDGTGFPVEVTINRVAGAEPPVFTGFIRDITQRRQLEEQLRQSQKMDAIGQLAGGVAHDFNNILTAIMMQAQAACQTENLPAKARGLLGDIRTDCQRATDLTRQLLAFSRQQVMQSRPLDLNETVTHLARMLQRIVGSGVPLNLSLHPKPLMIMADACMLDQVLLNLVVNARDAMPDGGPLTIELSEIGLDEHQSAGFPDARPGRYASLAVTDTGCGIAPEVLPRIFEPFFTTKEVGHGTGLGLATVFGIVKQHNGAIRVESEPGRCTTFRILLPAADLPGPPEETAAPPRGGTETILLVEDDVSLRQITRFVLERAGYQVLEAAHGEAALRVWEQSGGGIHLLLTDMVLPEGLGGHALADRLQERQPALPVIFTSGYSAEIAGRELSLRQGRNFLQKPYTPQVLLEAVRRCLDS